jgi:hypothetical protein
MYYIRDRHPNGKLTNIWKVILYMIGLHLAIFAFGDLWRLNQFSPCGISCISVHKMSFYAIDDDVHVEQLLVGQAFEAWLCYAIIVVVLERCILSFFTTRALLWQFPDLFRIYTPLLIEGPPLMNKADSIGINF